VLASDSGSSLLPRSLAKFSVVKEGDVVIAADAANADLNISGLSGANLRSRWPDDSGVRRWARLNRRNKAAFAVGRIRITALAAIKVAHDRGDRQAVDQNR
jgi:hypothetical protein